MTKSTLKAFEEREKALKEYTLRESKQPVVVDPSRKKVIDFIPRIKILEATKESDEETIQKLVQQHGKEILNSHDFDGITPLHRAILDENLETFELILKEGANPNALDRGLWSPLHLAASRGDSKIVQELLKLNKTDILLADQDSKFPLDVAESDAVKKLLKGEYTKKDIKNEQMAEAKEKLEKMMLEDIKLAHLAKKDLNQRSDEEGATLLHVAVSRGYFDCVKYLLETCHVNPNIGDVDGWTPLHCACFWNRAQLIGLLHRNKADLDKPSHLGELPSELTADLRTLNAIKMAKNTNTNRKRALENWSKIRMSLKLVLVLKDLRIKAGRNGLSRKSSVKKSLTKKIDTQKEMNTLVNSRLSYYEDANSKSSPITETQEKPTEKRKKRRATGQATGPALIVSGVTENSINVSWNDFEQADYFKISYEIEDEPDSKVVFSNDFQGNSVKIIGLKSNKRYTIAVMPSIAGSFFPSLQSEITITTSESSYS